MTVLSGDINIRLITLSPPSIEREEEGEEGEEEEEESRKKKILYRRGG